MRGLLESINLHDQFIASLSLKMVYSGQCCHWGVSNVHVLFQADSQSLHGTVGSSDSNASSWCRMEGNTPVVFLSRADARPSLQLQDYFDIDQRFAEPGFRRPDGSHNWACPCVASYVTGPCGIFFRRLLQNMERFIAAPEPDPNKIDLRAEMQLRHDFERLHGELRGCLSVYPKYYHSFIMDYGAPLDDAMKDVKDMH